MLMTKRPTDALPADKTKPVSGELQVRFGANLRAARTAQRLKQQDLADKSGFGQQYVSRVEDGQINLTLETMERLACALGMDVSTLLAAPSGGSSESAD